MNAAISGSMGSPVDISSDDLIGLETRGGAGAEVVTEGSIVVGEEVMARFRL